MNNVNDLKLQIIASYKKIITSFLKKQPKKRYYIGYDTGCEIHSYNDIYQIIAIKLTDKNELMFFVDYHNDNYSSEDVFFETDGFSEEDEYEYDEYNDWYTLKGIINLILYPSYIDELLVLRLIADAVNCVNEVVNEQSFEFYDNKSGEIVNYTPKQEEKKLGDVDIIL